MKKNASSTQYLFCGRRKRGSASVELAVVMPILFLFLFGIVEFGRVMSVSHVISTAAREGARVAAMPGTDNAIVSNVIQNELTGAGLTFDSVAFTPSDLTSANPNEPVTVQVSINYSSFGWVQGYFPALTGMQLQSSVIMRKEGIG